MKQSQSHVQNDTHRHAREYVHDDAITTRTTTMTIMTPAYAGTATKPDGHGDARGVVRLTVRSF